jgi:uncharacterized protein (DUF433 family)
MVDTPDLTPPSAREEGQRTTHLLWPATATYPVAEVEHVYRDGRRKHYRHQLAIVETPDVVGGQPRLDGHRIAVKLIADGVWRCGDSATEYADGHDLALEEVALALRYAEAQRDVIEAAWLVRMTCRLRRSSRSTRLVRPTPPNSRPSTNCSLPCAAGAPSRLASGPPPSACCSFLRTTALEPPRSSQPKPAGGSAASSPAAAGISLSMATSLPHPGTLPGVTDLPQATRTTAHARAAEQREQR